MIKYRYTFLILIFSIVFTQWPGSENGGKMPSIGIVSGSVIDSTTSQPLEYASISLVNIRSNELVTGGLSDKNGNFNIKEIPLGKYLAVIEFVGYSKKQISPINLFPGKGGGIEKDLGKIMLQISSVNLSEVEVLGESQFIQTIDKQIFTVGKNLASTGGSGEDVLRQVPTVDVDIDGNITLRGDANVTILIDGKKVGFDRRTMVDNLQASMIKKVEVITNPSAKYDPDGVGGIINLVLKRGAFEGLNGSTNLSAGQYNKNNIAGNLNFRSDKFNLFGSASARTGERYSKGYRDFEFDYYTPSDRIEYLIQDTENTRNSENISFRFGGDLYPNKNSTLSYTSTFGNKNQNAIENIIWIEPFDSTLIMKENENENNWNHSLSYENKFNSQNKKLNASIDYSKGFEEETESTIENTRSASDKNDYGSSIILLDYENKLFDIINLESGFKTTLKNVVDNLNYLNQDYSYNYNEDIYAIYTTLGYQVSDKIGIKGGLRYEEVKTKASVTGDTTEPTGVIHSVINSAIEAGEFNNPYKKYYPSIFLNYKLTDRNQIQFGYSKRVNRPGLGSLNPFPRDLLDETRIRNGNPFVRPEFSDVSELNFSSNSRKINFNTGISYKLTTDAIAWWDRDEIFYDSDGDGEPETYELLTSGNAEKAENLSGSVVVNYRPMPLISMMLTTWWWSSKTTGGQYENDMTGTSLGMFNRGQLTLNIPKYARIEISAGGRGKMKITSGTIPASYGADLGIEKSFFNKSLSVTLKVNDLFDSRKFILDTKQDYTDYTQIMYAERKRGRRTTSLNFRYNFGKQQKKRWDGKRYNRGGGSGGGMDMDY